MEVMLSREKFLAALESVKPGLAQRELVEQSTCFVFRDSEVLTYNDEALCRGPSGLPKAFTGVIQASELLECLRRVESEDVRLSSDEDVFAVSSKGVGIDFAMETDVRLPLDSVDRPKKWFPLHEDFSEAVAMVQSCAGKDETRFALVCVNLGKDWVEAADDFQACRWHLDVRLKLPALVRQNAVQSIGRLGVTEFAESDHWVHFRNARGFQLSCRRYSEEYPSDVFTPYLEKEGTPVTLPRALKEACELANVFSSQQGDVNLVQVDLKPGTPGKVTVTGQGLTGKVRRTLECNWKGERLTFQIPPALLGELVTRHNEVQLSDNTLRVQGGSFTYVSMLTKVPQEEEKPVRKTKKARDTQE